MTRSYPPRRRRADVLRRLQAQVDTITAAYRAGATIRDLAADHDCSYTSMRTLLTRAGVDLRGRGGSRAHS
ncbi:hypothetical protein GCM10027570_25030 [Streptomonospora sediminis]